MHSGLRVAADMAGHRDAARVKILTCKQMPRDEIWVIVRWRIAKCEAAGVLLSQTDAGSYFCSATKRIGALFFCCVFERGNYSLSSEFQCAFAKINRENLQICRPSVRKECYRRQKKADKKCVYFTRNAAFVIMFRHDTACLSQRCRGTGYAEELAAVSRIRAIMLGCR